MIDEALPSTCQALVATSAMKQKVDQVSRDYSIQTRVCTNAKKTLYRLLFDGIYYFYTKELVLTFGQQARA
jgi:hypothetical protein